jgi:DNA-binding HxlR family transcriptional regulator
MAKKRSYADPCGIARALDVVGERWALLVVRELLLGPKRFTDLRSGLPHAGPDMLSARLRELEHAGLIRRSTLPPPAGSRVYELTDRGRELEPVILALGRWGSRAPFPQSEAPLSVDALMIALKTVFDPMRAGNLDATYTLRVDDQTFTARVSDGALELGRVSDDGTDPTLEADRATLTRVLWHGEQLDEALRAGRLRLSGERQAVERFLALFPAPRPIENPVQSESS